MTEEERSEIEEQIKALQESQSVLSREYERQQQEAKDLVEKLVEQKVTLLVFIPVVMHQFCDLCGFLHGVGLINKSTVFFLLIIRILVFGVCVGR